MPMNAKQKKYLTYGGIGALVVGGGIVAYEVLKPKPVSPTTGTGTGSTNAATPLQITSVTLSAQ